MSCKAKVTAFAPSCAIVSSNVPKCVSITTKKNFNCKECDVLGDGSCILYYPVGDNIPIYNSGTHALLGNIGELDRCGTITTPTSVPYVQQHLPLGDPDILRRDMEYSCNKVGAYQYDPTDHHWHWYRYSFSIDMRQHVAPQKRGSFSCLLKPRANEHFSLGSNVFEIIMYDNIYYEVRLKIDDNSKISNRAMYGKKVERTKEVIEDCDMGIDQPYKIYRDELVVDSDFNHDANSFTYFKATHMNEYCPGFFCSEREGDRNDGGCYTPALLVSKGKFNSICNKLGDYVWLTFNFNFEYKPDFELFINGVKVLASDENDGIVANNYDCLSDGTCPYNWRHLPYIHKPHEIHTSGSTLPDIDTMLRNFKITNGWFGSELSDFRLFNRWVTEGEIKKFTNMI